MQYYNKLPKECNVDVAIILEPVIATGKIEDSSSSCHDVWIVDGSFLGQLMTMYRVCFCSWNDPRDAGLLKTWGVEKSKIVSTVASKQGLQEVCEKNPNVEIFLAAIDDGLSEVSSCSLVLLLTKIRL